MYSFITFVFYQKSNDLFLIWLNVVVWSVIKCGRFRKKEKKKKKKLETNKIYNPSDVNKKTKINQGNVDDCFTIFAMHFSKLDSPL